MRSGGGGEIKPRFSLFCRHNYQKGFACSPQSPKMHTGVTGGSRAGQCRLAILCLALGSASAFSGAPSILNLGSCRGALLVRGSTCDKFVGGAAPRAMKGVLKIRAAASEWTEVKDEASGNGKT